MVRHRIYGAETHHADRRLTLRTDPTDLPLQEPNLMKHTADVMQHPLPNTANTTPLPASQGKVASTNEQPAAQERQPPGMTVPPSSLEKDAWSKAARLACTGIELAQEPHQAPHLLERTTASGAEEMPAIQAAQLIPETTSPTARSIVVDLKYTDLGEHRHKLKQIFAAHQVVTAIKLVSAKPIDVIWICNPLRHFTGLRHIDVEFQHTPDTRDFEEWLAEQLVQVRSLTSVKLNVIELRHMDGSLVRSDILLSRLAASTTLESIELVGGYISPDGIRHAFDKLRKGRLQSLAMPYFESDTFDDTGDKCAVITLLDCAATIPLLKHLSLPSYDLSIHAAKEMAALLANSRTLESLEASLQFGYPGEAQIFGAALASNTSVKSLTLWIDFRHEFDYETENEEERIAAVNHLSPEALPYGPIAHGLTKNQTLQHVKFCFSDYDMDFDERNALATREAGLIVTAIGQHPCITIAEFDLSDIGNIKDVLSLLQDSPRLQILTVIAKLPSPEIYEQLAQAIEKHPPLSPPLRAFELRLPHDRNLADTAVTEWEIDDAREVFERTERRIALALAQNQGYVLGADLNAMMEARAPTPGMLPTPPLEISQLLMTHAMLVLPDADRQNVIDAFRL